MSKSIYLYVTGGDYSAMVFENNYNIQEFYQQMIDEEVTEKIIDEEEDYIEVYIKEFKEVDDYFEMFIKNELCDYDQLKATNIYKVN